MSIPGSVLSQFVKNHFLKYPISMGKTTSLLKPKTKYTDNAEINTLPALQGSLWVKMLKLTPPLNSC